MLCSIWAAEADGNLMAGLQMRHAAMAAAGAFRHAPMLDSAHAEAAWALQGLEFESGRPAPGTEGL